MACKYAIQLAADEQIRLCLFHAYPDQLIVPDSSFPTGVDTDALINTEFINELRDQAVKNMDDLFLEVSEFLKQKAQHNVDLMKEVKGGDPHWEVYHYAENMKPDLVVMGTRGKGEKGFLEGSMAEHLMNKLKCPVLAVPDTIKKIKLKNIMYATNFSVNDFKQLESLLNIIKDQEVHFHIVHFEIKGRVHEHESMMSALKNGLKSTHSERQFTFHFMDLESKSEALSSFTSEFDINVIGFIAHKTNIFKNLFSSDIHKKDFFKLELPMLALHE